MNLKSTGRLTTLTTALIAATMLSSAQAAATGSCGPDGPRLLGYSDAFEGLTVEGAQVGGLSSLAYDAERDRFFVLADRHTGTANQARIHEVEVPVEGGKLGTPEIVKTIILRYRSGKTFPPERFDGEGLVYLERQEELVVLEEYGPSIARFGTDGVYRGSVVVPDSLTAAQRTAGGFEGLAATADGRSLFVAPERALLDDGPTDAPGTVQHIRISRLDRDGGRGYRPAHEYHYVMSLALGTDDPPASPFPPYAGITEITALDSERLLVMERSYDPEDGYRSHVYEVSVGGAQDATGRDLSLVRPLRKRLVLDVARCPAGDAPPADAGVPSANHLNGNYEGLALGPSLGGGRRLLLQVMDDNYNLASQTTRLLAYSIEERRRDGRWSRASRERRGRPSK